MDRMTHMAAAEAEQELPRLGHRSGESVMSPVWAAASQATPLSFARMAVAELARQRFVLERLRIDIDCEGRGEFLYRYSNGSWVFHFFVLSDSFPAEMKIDRNFGTNWDAMAILCQGEWTAERERHMRREIPKARMGITDYDSLIYARGNRSGRLFDQVVDELAQGRQPDGAKLAQIGYILRTTAFIGNGAMGTRPWAGFEPDHPLRRPYYAQMCAAYLLREYVCDLVDHMARLRNPAGATALSPAYRRYLGIGNSAATGLVPFVTQRPQVIHRWCLSRESAFARAEHRPVDPDSGQWRDFLALMAKAVAYYEQSDSSGDGIFLSSGSMAAELARCVEQAGHIISRLQSDAEAASLDVWGPLLSWACANVHPEAVELLRAVILELYPDLIEEFANLFQADESMDVQPAMELRQLRNLLRARYGWALSVDMAHPDAPHYFWYRGKAAPLDMRRGVRGLIADDEFEMGTDTVLKIHQLNDSLEALPGDMTVARMLLDRPDLRYIVARVQTLAQCEYAELRSNYLDRSYTPYAPIRLVLSFYGMERLVAAPPKSVRGALLQGAPTAQDTACGMKGDWPFPLIPREERGSTRVAAQRFLQEGNASPETRARADDQPDDSSITMSPSEVLRFAQKALQGGGASLGMSGEGARAVAFAQMLWGSGLSQLALQLRPRNPWAPGAAQFDAARPAILSAKGRPALAVSQEALDLACAMASSSVSGVGAAWVEEGSGMSLLDHLPLQAARRGMIGVLTWFAGMSGGAGPLGAARTCVAGPGTLSPWFVGAELLAPSRLYLDLSAGLSDRGHAIDSVLAEHFFLHNELVLPDSLFLAEGNAVCKDEKTGFAMICLRPACLAMRGEALYESVREQYMLAQCGRHSVAYSEEHMRNKFDEAHRHGLQIDRGEWNHLLRLATDLLIDPDHEPLLRPEGVDPQKFL